MDRVSYLSDSLLQILAHSPELFLLDLEGALETFLNFFLFELYFALYLLDIELSGL